MENPNTNIEDMSAGVILVAQELGIALNWKELSDSDLYTLVEKLQAQVGDVADRILALGEKVACGIYPMREIRRLKNRLPTSASQTDGRGDINDFGSEPLTGLSPIQPVELNGNSGLIDDNNLEQSASHPPWYYRNLQAIRRLPKSGCIFSKPVARRQVHRGARRYKSWLHFGYSRFAKLNDI